MRRCGPLFVLLVLGLAGCARVTTMAEATPDDGGTMDREQPDAARQAERTRVRRRREQRIARAHRGAARDGGEQRDAPPESHGSRPMQGSCPLSTRPISAVRNVVDARTYAGRCAFDEAREARLVIVPVDYDSIEEAIDARSPDSHPGS